MTDQDARDPLPPVLAGLRVDDRIVAEYRDGQGVAADLSPRPFLHPVRTLAGTPVTDAFPADHRWHLGAGVAIQDVDGTNLWGGPTYRRNIGYTWADDHGLIEHLGFVERSPKALVVELSWRAPDGHELLREWREMRTTPVTLPATTSSAAQAIARGWRLNMRCILRNSTGTDLFLGSPASNGRSGAGYGGFFWRLPSLSHIRIYTTDTHGEAEVNGRPAPWLALHGRVRTETTQSVSRNPEVTLVFHGADEQTRHDPWFVRLEDYPGIGSSLATESPVILSPQTHLQRCIDVTLFDGRIPITDAVTDTIEAVPTR